MKMSKDCPFPTKFNDDTVESEPLKVSEKGGRNFSKKALARKRMIMVVT